MPSRATSAQSHLVYIANIADIVLIFFSDRQHQSFLNAAAALSSEHGSQKIGATSILPEGRASPKGNKSCLVAMLRTVPCYESPSNVQTTSTRVTGCQARACWRRWGRWSWLDGGRDQTFCHQAVRVLQRSSLDFFNFFFGGVFSSDAKGTCIFVLFEAGVEVESRVEISFLA